MPAKPAPSPLAPEESALVAKYLPFVRRVAARVARKVPAHVDFDDLISSGVLGLIDAARRFDPGRNEKFEAFAEFRIRGAMLDDLRSRDTLSRDMRRLSNELRDATRKLEAQLGRTPDQEEIAQRLGVNVDELYARQQKLSGSSVVGIDDAGPDLLDCTEDRTAEDPFDRVALLELIAAIEAAALTLPDKIRSAFTLRCQGWQMKEIGAAMGYTESRACQVMAEAHAKLRAALRRAGGAKRLRERCAW